MINFRYNVIQVLGRGGGGEVLLVDDTLTGRQVAMKVLEAAGDEQSLLDAEKEFSVLSSLDHPNVIRVHEMGTLKHDDDDRAKKLYYTMEFIGGSDAGKYFEGVRNTPEFGEHLELFAVQALGALAYIHARGLTHFDIKPQNLLMANASIHVPFNAVLTDFGFSAHEVENVENPLRGTMEYTAPEIFQGNDADNRSDLYSLGVTLFELISGHCPFEAKDPVELIQRVLNDELPKLKPASEVPASLVSLTTTLCRKNPLERPQTAEAALQVLRSERFSEPIDELIFRARKPSFTGRVAELRKIDERLKKFAEAPEHHRGVFNILSTHGLGVSTLLDAVQRLANARGQIVLYLTGTGTQSGTSNELQNIVTRLCMEVRTNAGVIADSAPFLAPDSSFAADEETADFLIEASHAAPFVLLVDSANSENAATKEMLERIFESDAEVFALCSNFPKPESKSLVRHESMNLGELTEEDISAMMRGAFPDSNPAEMAKRLYELCGGIPRAVVPIIESLLRGNTAGPDGEGIMIDDCLPGSVLEFFAMRLNSYSEPARRALMLLSCFETPPSKEIVTTLFGGMSLGGEAVLNELSKGAEFSARNDGRYDLRLGLAKRTAYQELGSENVRTHARIADAFDKFGTLTDWRDIREHARQYQLAGTRDRAATLYEHAAGAARKAERFGDAAHLFRKALDGVNEIIPGERVQLLKKLADTLYADGKFQPSIDAATEILNTPGQPDGQNAEFRGSVLVAMGKSYSRLGEFVQAKERLREARAFLAGDRGRFEIEQEMIGIEIAEGKFEQAVIRCEKLKSAAAQIGDNQLLASVHTDLGIANFYLGQLDQALASFREAHRLYTVSGNLAKTVDASINSGNVLSAKGDYRGALVEGIQALDESRKLGNRNQQAQILNNLGIAHYHLREYEQAGARYEEALAIFLEMNSTSGLALARLNLGEVALALSHYEKALNHWNVALRLYGEMNDPAGTADAALHLARVHVIVENVSQLESLIEQARTVSIAAKLQEFDADIEYLEGQRQLLSGNPEQARESFCAAVKLFTKRDLDGAGDKEKTLRASIDFSRTLALLGDREKAVAGLSEIESALGEFPLLGGEYRLLMGICRESDAMNQYKLGLAAIADLDVSETTWKLMYALGQELARRGNSLKAREHIERARMVLRYLAEQFHSPELRAQYLNGNERAPVLRETPRGEPSVS